MKKLLSFLAVLALLLSLGTMAFADSVYDLPGSGLAITVPDGYSVYTADTVTDGDPIIESFDMTRDDYLAYLEDTGYVLEVISNDVDHEFSFSWFDTETDMDFRDISEAEMLGLMESNAEFYAESGFTVSAIEVFGTGSTNILVNYITDPDGWNYMDIDCIINGVWVMVTYNPYSGTLDTDDAVTAAYIVDSIINTEASSAGPAGDCSLPERTYSPLDLSWNDQYESESAPSETEDDILFTPSGDDTVYALPEVGLEVTVPAGFASILTSDPGASPDVLESFSMDEEEYKEYAEELSALLCAFAPDLSYEIDVTAVDASVVDGDYLSDYGKDMDELLVENIDRMMEDQGVDIESHSFFETHPQARFLVLHHSKSFSSSIQYYTVYNGNAINFVFHRYDGTGISAEDELLMERFVSSVRFTDGRFADSSWQNSAEAQDSTGRGISTAIYLILAGLGLVLLVVVIVIIAGAKARKKRAAETAHTSAAASFKAAIAEAEPVSPENDISPEETPVVTGNAPADEQPASPAAEAEPVPGSTEAEAVPVIRASFCKFCGSRLPEGASFCTKCGKKID